MTQLVVGWAVAVFVIGAGDKTSQPNVATRPRAAAFESVTVEAEACSAAGAKREKLADASKGQAMLLDGPRVAIQHVLTLPAGAYSIQVRAKAKDADTFNELAVKAGGQVARPVYPTNSVFTRMKAHFQQAEHGPAKLTLSLAEGSGVYVDQIRIFRQDLGYRFKRLKPLHLTTALAEQRMLRCQIVLPENGSYRDHGQRIAAAIGKRCGRRPKIWTAPQIERKDFQRSHLIMLGDIYTNLAILRTNPRTWAHVPRPEVDEFNLMTIHNPHGTGKNVVVVGGRDAPTVGRATDELIRRLPEGPTVTIPRIWLPAWPMMDRNELKELMVESGKWIRHGAIRTLQNRWKARGIEGFRLLGYRYIEYKESADTITQRRDDGFSDAEFYKVISAWDRWEEDPYFTDAERLELTDAMWRFFQMCIDPYGRYVAGGHHLKLSEIVKRVRQAKPTIRHNHQTFPATSFQYAADYFGTYYRLPEAKELAELAKFVFDGQRPCAKPQCDCAGYQSITMAHMIRHAVSQDDWAYVNSPQVRQFLKLLLVSHDNQGMPVGYGDSGGYIGEPNPNWRDPQVYAGIWMAATAGGFDHRQIKSDNLLGVYVHPLEPAWHACYKGEPPVVRCFDKICFRAAHDPQRAYLLLDGLSRGYHGHWDGNALLRLTDNGRVWLGEGDYLNGDLKDHNTVTIVKDGVSGRPPICSTLESHVDFYDFGATWTRTADYCDTTWDRHVLWHKADDVFVLIDRLTAQSDGTFDCKCRFRTFGQVRREGSSVEVSQKDGERFFIRSAAPCKLRLADDARDGQKNWSKYPYAEPVTRLVVQQAVLPLKAGQSHAFVNLMFAKGESESKDYRALGLGPGVTVARGTRSALIGLERADVKGLAIKAKQFWAGPHEVFLVGGAQFQCAGLTLEADPPADLAWVLKRDSATIRAAVPTRLSFVLPRETSLTIGDRTYVSTARPDTTVVELPVGTHTVTLTGLTKRLATALGTSVADAWQTASKTAKGTTEGRPGHLNSDEAWRLELPARVTTLKSADMNGNGADEVLVGCEDGTLRVVGADGKPMWGYQFTARVNDVCAADLDGDGRAEVIAGVEDERVHVVKSGGTLLWSRRFEPYQHNKAHVRVVHAADFDRDGKPEVAVGCANSYFFALDNTGKLRVDKDGARWELKTYHQASAIGSADVDGDKHLELLAGCTYFARYIRSFHRRHGSKVHTLGGCISGCGTIATADVDGDGNKEAVFADKDGRIAAAEKNGPYEAKVLWEGFVGDDAITKVIADDLDRDNKPDLLAASRSGLLACMSATDGKIKWLQYGQADMNDAAAADVSGDARPEAIAANQDGCVYVFDASGKLVARRQLGASVSRLAGVRSSSDGKSTIVAAVGHSIVAVRCR